ncbi:MAG: hypothetical protein COY81_05105 [Candidatus Pacebacteria bacterium CG_4_10_14_0_8_um_filter_43_12]|nr:MAG: hypothetical protein COY81_05105 [Candidatus Pacebacteria bacterium CG_4_10_14_0_8_um_filter_43_12]
MGIIDTGDTFFLGRLVRSPSLTELLLSGQVNNSRLSVSDTDPDQKRLLLWLRKKTTMGYSKQALRGFGWHSVVTFLTATMTALKLAFLARLLDQREFGLFAYITIALGLTEAITETGINVTIIQAKESIKYFLNTAWVIAIFRGLIIGLVMLGMGVSMSSFFSEPNLTVLVGLAALVPVVKGFINPAIVTLHKELRFFRDSVYRLSLLVVEAGLAVLLAWYWHSVTALVVAMIGAAVFEVIISFLLFRLRPVFEYIPSRAKSIFNNAKGLSVSAALSYISENVDDLILGKLLGTAPLGLYHTGYSLTHRATLGVSQSLSHGAFPVFAQFRTDLPRLKRAFLKSFLGLSLLLVAVLIPLIGFPKLIIEIILGQKWLAVVPALPWLAAAGALQALTSLCYTVMTSTESYKQMNAHRIFGLIVFVPLFLWLSLQFGLLGAAMGWAIARAISFPVVFWLVLRRLK